MAIRKAKAVEEIKDHAITLQQLKENVPAAEALHRLSDDEDYIYTCHSMMYAYLLSKKTKQHDHTKCAKACRKGNEHPAGWMCQFCREMLAGSKDTYSRQIHLEHLKGCSMYESFGRRLKTKEVEEARRLFIQAFLEVDGPLPVEGERVGDEDRDLPAREGPQQDHAQHGPQRRATRATDSRPKRKAAAIEKMPRKSARDAARAGTDPLQADREQSNKPEYEDGNGRVISRTPGSADRPFDLTLETEDGDEMPRRQDLKQDLQEDAKQRSPSLEIANPPHYPDYLKPYLKWLESAGIRSPAQMKAKAKVGREAQYIKAIVEECAEKEDLDVMDKTNLRLDLERFFADFAD